uniref:GDP-fucose protein O-fucosyltransferase 2 n=1 Tax=Rhabditophanes sp. KR3021 TaxID=114890 RepID=A0AC35TUQ7_9BILA
MKVCILLCLIIPLIVGENINNDDVTISKLDLNKFSMQEKKYIIYDVNPGEGFNLRRDVYLRVSNFVRQLRLKGFDYTLVLPPWGGLYHWKKGESQVKWRQFFDIASLNQFVPVIEFEEFMQNYGKTIDLVLYLQNYREGWGEKYEIKFDERECNENNYYYKEKGKIMGWFFGYEKKVNANKLQCLSIQGHSETLVQAILKNYNNYTAILIDRCETILHDHFSDEFYWKSRRSMRYASELVKKANSFRKETFGSDDDKDKTVLDKEWELTERKHGEAVGGEYICVHWRRGDFVRAHAKEIPSIKGTAHQIIFFASKYGIENVFISSDCTKKEFAELQTETIKFLNLSRYQDSSLSDGSVSIIDQSICSHARAFIGSYVSTFSFRIHEDREILGFEPESTFNRLCPDDKLDCEQPTKWKIQY